MYSDLYHKAEQKATKKDFKYVGKITKGKTTRYFYSRDEWQAYLRGRKKTKDTDKTIQVNKENNTKYLYNNIKPQTSFKEKTLKTADIVKNSAKQIGDLVKNGKNRLKNVIEKMSDDKSNDAVTAAKTVVSNAINSGEKIVKTLINNNNSPIESDTTKKQAENGKTFVNEKANKNFDFILLLPTDMVRDVIDRVTDFLFDDSTTYSEEDEPAKTSGEPVESWSDVKLKDREYTPDEDQAVINPLYDPYDRAYSTNCAYCTAAYDLRQRGYDVEAGPKNASIDSDMHYISLWYKNTSVNDWDVAVSENTDEMFANTLKALEEMPSGSYGQFNVVWKYGGGHSMVFENRDGATTIRDCQINETYTYSEWVDTYGDMVDATCWLRTDNREPSDVMLRVIRNRKEEQ